MYSRVMCYKSILLACLFLIQLQPAQAQNQKDAIQPFKLGVLLTLSGALAEYGVALRQAFELAQQTSPDTFKSLELVFDDYGSDPKVAVSAFQKLTSIDGVQAVYIWGATPTDALAPIAEAKKIPLVAMSLKSDAARGRAFVVRTVATSKDFVRPLVQHILREQKVSSFRTLQILKTEWAYTDELSRVLVAALGESVKTQEISFNRSDMDFLSAITKIRAQKPEVLGIFLSTGQIRTFFKQLGPAAANFRIYGDDFFGSQDEIKGSGPGIQGVFFPQIATCDKFSTLYRSKFGSETHIPHATNAFDMANLFAQVASAIEAHKDFLQELQKPSIHQGICDQFTFVDSPELGKYFDYPVALYKVSGDRAVRVRHPDL